jgi:hypothetical protein
MGWRDTQAKIESGELNYKRSARSNFDIFADSFASSFDQSFRDRQAAEREATRYERGRADKLSDEQRREKRVAAIEAEKIRRLEAKSALDAAQEAEKVEAARRRNARKLLSDNGKDANNPNFVQFAMDHVEAYDDSYSSANEAFTTLLPRLTEIGPAQGPLMRRSDVNLGESFTSTDRAYENRSEMDDPTREAFEGTIEDITGGDPLTRDGFDAKMNEQMDDILGSGAGKSTGVRAALRAGESNGDASAVDFNTEDGKDHVGLYQVGELRLKDYNNSNGTKHSIDDLKKMSAEEQEEIADWHFSDIDKFIDTNGLDKYIGQTVGGVEITRSGMIAMAHLGGNTGMMQFLETGGEYNPDDSGSGVKGNSLADYAKKYADEEPTTSRSASDAGDDPSAYSVFEIEPPTKSAFEFSSLKKDTYRGVAKDYRNKGNSKLATEIEEFGDRVFGTTGSTKLTDGDYARLYASYSRMKSSTDPAEVAAANAWFNNEESSLREGLEAAGNIGKKPNETVYYITTNGKRILARVGDGDTYIPLDPNNGETVDGASVTEVLTEDSVELIKDGLNAVSTQTRAQRNKMTAATTVAMEGYDLVQMAKDNEVVLTLVGGAGAAIGSMRQEAEALFNVLGESAQSNMDQETILGKMYEYIDGNKGISDDATIAAYRNFSAAMVRYVFSAGKALGQEGNGFSNQDYNNIKSAMFAGKGIEGFEENLQTFARQRMAEATRSSKLLSKSGQVMFANQNGTVFGSDLWTAEEFFQNTSVEGDPDYYGWANSSATPTKNTTNTRPVESEGKIQTAEELFVNLLDIYKRKNQTANYTIMSRVMRKRGFNEEDIKKAMDKNYVPLEGGAD